LISDAIILTCIRRLQGERTISSIYHLLKGKKSIQTVQDSHIYQLANFFGIHSSLTKQEFNRKVYEFIEMDYIRSIEDDKKIYALSENGREYLHKYSNKLNLDYFQGLQLSGIADEFYLRLLLLIQTLTNTKMEHYHFIPISDNALTERWVKQTYPKMRNNEGKILQSLYQELHHILKQFAHRDASVFVDRLTGYKHYGLSTNQLSKKYNLQALDVHLLLTGIIHRIVSLIQKENDRFPILAYIMKDIAGKLPLTNSANQTYQLFMKDYTIEQMARIRNLKINTIHDHLVEIALYDHSFPFNKYLTVEEQKEILSVLNAKKTFKLKDIKQAVNENISYFQIRLVLATNKTVMK